ncbi:MAG TPA: hypothetical protein VIB79_30630 [Candidatus Binatia bacterium]
MAKKFIARTVTTGMIIGAFSVGYFYGSITQRQVDAQGLGGILEQAGKAGGPIGTVGQLGSSIVEMQDHVNGLQKNIDTLKKIQSALGGGK